MIHAAIIFLIFALLCLLTAIRKDGHGAWGLAGFPWLIGGTLLAMIAFVLLAVTA